MNLHFTVYTKKPEEIKIMREGGQIMASIMETLRNMITPGISTWDLEEKFISLCNEYSVIPSCKGYAPHFMSSYPTGLCVSVNNQCVHCFPKRSQVLKEGDIITVDTVIKFKDFHLDSAFCIGVGTIGKRQQKLLDVTRQTFDKAVSQVMSGVRVGVISNTIQKHVERNGFNVLREFAGHGIGRNMHEPPEIPCWGKPTEGMVLDENMVICIESLVCEGSPRVQNISDWETQMADGKFFAQYEHTVLVTNNGYELLTAKK